MQRSKLACLFQRQRNLLVPLVPRRSAAQAASHEMGKDIALRGGAKMPALGFGTWQSKPGEVEKAVALAIKEGYRHLDFAKCYGNQAEVAKGIKDGLKETGLKREDLFLVSKLWNSQHKPKDVASALDDTLQELGLDYLDLYIIHFPVSFKSSAPNTELFPKVKGADPEELLIDFDTSIVETWKAMTELPKSKARAVGVSNFSVEQLETIIKATGQIPECDQVERHPKLQDHELLAYAAKNKIAIVAYSPLGNNMFEKPLLTEHPVIKEVAKETGATPGQVLLAWGMEHGCSVIPKTVTPARVGENFKSSEVKLSADAVKRIDEIGTKEPERYNIPWIANKPRWRINIFNTKEEQDLPAVVLGQA